MLVKLAEKIKFTVQELRVLLFLCVTFITGFGYKAFFIQEESPVYKNFDYSEQDSLFQSVNEEYKNSVNKSSQTDKIVDYKQEVLDFNTRNFQFKAPKEPPAEKSIDLNSATIDDLVRLPGIGEKTAERIIELRNKRTRFRNLEELKDVRGIGEAKYSNIKKFLYIEK